ncbi:uncharacterized protein TNCV_1462291 [Trichonephila clavipes]|nr:uncharacterized protein TNCV_1462291 [Trichonephila clavipes]
MNSKYLRRIQRRILLRVICGYRTISYDSVYALSGFPQSTLLFFIILLLGENLSASSISNYDCILSPFFIPHPSERNAINTVQFSEKSTEDFLLFAILMAVKLMEELVSHLLCSGVVLNPRTFNLEFVMNAQFFVAELLCLNFAVKWITEQNSVISEYLICTDSLSSLDSLKCISSSNNIIPRDPEAT